MLHEIHSISKLCIHFKLRFIEGPVLFSPTASIPGLLMLLLIGFVVCHSWRRMELRMILLPTAEAVVTLIQFFFLFPSKNDALNRVEPRKLCICSRTQEESSHANPKEMTPFFRTTSLPKKGTTTTPHMRLSDRRGFLAGDGAGQELKHPFRVSFSR